MIRILDLTRGVAGGFTSMFLSQLGAEVTPVEFEGTSRDGERSPAQTSYFLRGTPLQRATIETAGQRAAFTARAASYDVVLDDRHPDGAAAAVTEWADLHAMNANVILTSVTPFGLEGPRAHWKSSELVQQAMGGIVAASGQLGRPPQRLGASQAAHVAGLHAAIVTLATVCGVRAGVVEGAHIDVSIQEVMSSHWTREIGRYVYTGEDTGRAGGRNGLQGFPHTAETSDGYVFLLPLRVEWEAFAALIGLDQFVTAEWTDPEVRTRRWDEIEPHFVEALRSRGRYDWFTAAAARGWTFAPIDDPLSVLASPQLAARGFFHSSAELAGVTMPGLPFTRTPIPEED